MAKSSQSTSEMQTAAAAGYDPDAGLAADFGPPAGTVVQSSAAEISGRDAAERDARAAKARDDARERTMAHHLTPDQRLEKLEQLAMLYFGSHHFEPPAPVYDPEAEKIAARNRFTAEMERIENEARAKAH